MIRRLVARVEEGNLARQTWKVGRPEAALPTYRLENNRPLGRTMTCPQRRSRRSAKSSFSVDGSTRWRLLFPPLHLTRLTLVFRREFVKCLNEELIRQ